MTRDSTRSHKTERERQLARSQNSTYTASMSAYDLPSPPSLTGLDESATKPVAIAAKVPERALAATVDGLRDSVLYHLAHTRGRDEYRTTQIDLLWAVSLTVRDRVADAWRKTAKAQWEEGKKRVYYLSMEYLPGRLLGDALLNLGLTENMRDALLSLGVDLQSVLDLEPDPALGNGGLGRLASCFLDSMATQSIAGMGYGILYQHGMFAQKIVRGMQVEEPDSWLRHGSPWPLARTETVYRVRYGGRVEARHDAAGRTFFAWEDTEDILAEAHDVPIPGFQNGVVNTLRLWNPRPVQEFDLNLFNSGDHTGSVKKRNIAEHISRVLYPNDSGPSGKELRLRQEYFFVSASLQDALRRHLNRWGTLTTFAEKNAMQLNDTHPAISIAELMRILLDEHRLQWEEAWDITRNTFAYTNHTLLPEALEHWPVYMLDQLLPRQLDIIREIDRRLGLAIRERYAGDEARIEHAEHEMAIVARGPQAHVRMGHLSVVGSFSVNGVSALHSGLVTTDLFPEYHAFYPGKFQNKTNGVTPRRWLAGCNPELAQAVDTALDSKAWRADFTLIHDLQKLSGSNDFLLRLDAIKRANKTRLRNLIEHEVGISVDENALFDVQIKRMHEYKRQLLNALRVVHEILAIRAGKTPAVSKVILFGGKAASAYDMAKRIISLINALAKTVQEDATLRKYLRVVFLPNYRVSIAETIIPAADLSEQISTAGFEASGTGNMKFAMNGALTIGTLDGANVEIRDAVGADNFFKFGLSVEEIAARKSHYNPRELYESDERIRNTLDAVHQGQFCPDEPGRFRPIVESLLNQGDRYFLLADFADYLRAHAQAEVLFQDKLAWQKKCLANIAAMGPFSSDETIKLYAKEIWRA